jgi:hypothetical protein
MLIYFSPIILLIIYYKYNTIINWLKKFIPKKNWIKILIFLLFQEYGR